MTYKIDYCQIIIFRITCMPSMWRRLRRKASDIDVIVEKQIKWPWRRCRQVINCIKSYTNIFRKTLLFHDNNEIQFLIKFCYFSLPLISVKDGHGPYSNGGKFKCKPGILPPKNFVYYKDSLVCGGCKSQYQPLITFIIPSVITVILKFFASRNLWSIISLKVEVGCIIVNKT